MAANRVTQMVLLLLFAALFVFTGSVFAPAGAAEQKTLKVAVLTSLTGMMSAGYKDISESVKPTEKFINEKGGVTINGQKYKVQLVVYDDQSAPPGAVAAANKVVQENIKFLLAPMFMPSNLAIAPITERAKIIRVQATTSGVEQYGPKNRFMFAASFTICTIPATYSYLTKNYPKAKKIARIVPDDPGAKAFNEYDVKEAKKHGLEIVFDEPFKIGVEDFYPLLTKALEKKPDAIDMGFSILPWGRGLITQARELGFNGPMYAPAFVGDTNLLFGLLEQKAGHDFFHGAADVLSPKMTPIIKEFRTVVEKDLGVKFNMDHTIVLEALWPLLQAISKTGSLDTEKIVSTWEKMKSIDSIYGKARMGGEKIIGLNHMVMRPALISRIVDKSKPIEFDYFESKDVL
jgi:branched-chain amino acid transport system substrate-binding protein